MRDIFKPSTPEEAVALSRKAAYIQGGTEVLRLGGGFDNEALIDLNPIIPKEVSRDGKELVIGAGATFQDLIENGMVPSWLKEALEGMASLQLRNQATIGGNIALRRDDSYAIPALVAAGAEVKILSEGGKVDKVAISEYIGGPCDGLILYVIIPAGASARTKRISLSSHMHAVLTAAVGTAGECYAIKGTGIVTSLEGVKYSKDMYGSAEYKKYISETVRDELR